MPCRLPMCGIPVQGLLGEHSDLHFFDAAAPLVSAESVDMDYAWMGSRYDKGTDDYVTKLFSIGIRLHRRLIRTMFPNDLLHPDHIIPPVKLIPAVLKSPAKTESKVLMELGTVLI